MTIKTKLLPIAFSLFSNAAIAETSLSDGVVHTIADSNSADLEFAITLDSSATSLNIFTQGKVGDADLELVEVNGAVVDCEVSYFGSNEACVIKAPQAGTYKFKIVAYEPFRELSVVAATDVYAQQHVCIGTSNETVLNIQSSLISVTQINEICATLTQAEQLFHQLLDTQDLSVPSDQNDTVYVNIFANQPAFMTTGQYLQNMQDSASTGIYFESSPESAAARANVNTFEALRWSDGEFYIWELAHEYVHYLDGRYNKQGDFQSTVNHNLTWWTEGLAEYIADNASPYMNVKLVHSPTAFSALDIVQSGYDGEASPYDWGSMLVKYMVEQRPSDLKILRDFAREGNYQQLDAWLNDWASDIDGDFQQWQTSTLLDEVANTAEALTLDQPTSVTSQHGLLYYIDLADAQAFSAQTRGGGGDLDIYIAKDTIPNKYDASQFLCRANYGQTDETCAIDTPESGRYFVLLDAPGYSIFVNSELTASEQLLTSPIDYQLCAAEVPYSGRDSNTNSDVSLSNDSDSTILVHWLNHNSGGRSQSSYATLLPGEQWDANWYLGDKFVLVDESSNCLAIGTLTEQSNSLSFDGQSVVAAETAEEEQQEQVQTPEDGPSDSGGSGSPAMYVLLMLLVALRWSKTQ